MDSRGGFADGFSVGWSSPCSNGKFHITTLYPRDRMVCKGISALIKKESILPM